MSREVREIQIGRSCRLNFNFNHESQSIRLVIWQRSVPAAGEDGEPGPWELSDEGRFRCDHATKLLRALNELEPMD